MGILGPCFLGLQTFQLGFIGNQGLFLEIATPSSNQR